MHLSKKIRRRFRPSLSKKTKVSHYDCRANYRQLKNITLGELENEIRFGKDLEFRTMMCLESNDEGFGPGKLNPYNEYLPSIKIAGTSLPINKKGKFKPSGLTAIDILGLDKLIAQNPDKYNQALYELKNSPFTFGYLSDPNNSWIKIFHVMDSQHSTWRMYQESHADYNSDFIHYRYGIPYQKEDDDVGIVRGTNMHDWHTQIFHG